MHVTPLTSAHFWSWLGLFNSVMSLPIRQGSLFPDLGPRSPKFGLHTASLKYRFDLDSFFLTHVYLQSSAAKYSQSAASFLGLKAKVEQFHLDVHQRQQETLTTRKELGDTRKTLHKPISEAEIDLVDFKLRVLGGEVKDSSTPCPDSSMEPDPALSILEKLMSKADQDPNNLESWWDDLDFVELGLNASKSERESARVRTIPVAECPRFTYTRKLKSSMKRDDRSDAEVPDRQVALGETKFGDEDSHPCYVGSSQSEQLELSLAMEGY